MALENNKPVRLDGEAKKGQEIDTLVHPLYDGWSEDWKKYRSIWKGGSTFIDEYLIRYSNREAQADFDIRKKVTYAPGHARSAILETKNSIYERFIDISRSGGSAKYQDWIKGLNGGVDGAGCDMDKFIGTVCLPELLVTKRVGVYVDAPQSDAITKADEGNFKPYAYIYRAEDIRTWARKGDSDQLSAVLLRDTVYTYNELGLVAGTELQFRLLTQAIDSETGKDIVVVRIFDSKGDEDTEALTVLLLSEIPFDFVDIDHSILNDVADHQIALLNLASSDLNYCLKANFPFYTEEFDPKTELGTFVTGGDDFSDTKPGTAANARESTLKTANVGVMNGRRYPKGTDRPGFISPSSEPLIASMKKQEEIRTEIRQLVLLSVSTLNPETPTNERDDQGLEAGLSFIGLTMQALERRIARFFALYENQDNPNIPTIKYPTDYKIRSEKSRREEADQLLSIMPKIPSTTYQKEVAIRVAGLTIGHWITDETGKKIDSEIKAAKIIVTDPKTLLEDLEKGLVSEETASLARLYPKGEVVKARIDHALRIARVLAAQTTANPPMENPAARGVKDLSVNKGEAAEEKKTSQNADANDIPKSKTRGDAK